MRSVVINFAAGSGWGDGGGAGGGGAEIVAQGRLVVEKWSNVGDRDIFRPLFGSLQAVFRGSLRNFKIGVALRPDAPLKGLAIALTHQGSSLQRMNTGVCGAIAQASS